MLLRKLETQEALQNYLQACSFIDIEHPLIVEQAKALATGQGRREQVQLSSEREWLLAKEIFQFVRDQVAHSFDIKGQIVTGRASEVLLHKQSICYGKSHLLAALMRAVGIPAGICYQRLTLGDTPETGYVIHALNTVYLFSLQKWIRLDARGNKPGVDAQFSIDEEKLAFPIREELGEIDYLINYAVPHPLIIETLVKHRDKSSMEMYLRYLPTHLD